MPSVNNKKVVFIIGPTAVGKTDLAIELAEKLNGEIISADSRYLYRGMNIGTAKPSMSQQKRVIHHLIDVADINENWSLSTYKKATLECINHIDAHKKLPFVVGGTGQYIYSLIEGWKIPELAPDYHLRNILDEWAIEIGSDVLFEKLKILDPDAANFIDARNVRRIIRALEITLRTGTRFSSQRKKEAVNFSFKLIGLTRERNHLFHLIDERIEKMWDEGFVEEVAGLIRKGYASNLPAMSAIGYKEICRYLNGEIGKLECIQLIKRRTRQFVRRQATWFKKDDLRIKWFDLDNCEMFMIEEYIRSKKGWQNE